MMWNAKAVDILTSVEHGRNGIIKFDVFADDKSDVDLS